MGTLPHLDALAKRIYDNADAHGFWPEEGRNFGEMISLMHSELSEALEEHREDNPVVYFVALCDGELMRCELKSDNRWWFANSRVVPIGSAIKPEGAAVELIDAIIRELDTLHNMLKDNPDYYIEDVIELKMAYNEGRPFKHGKAY